MRAKRMTVGELIEELQTVDPDLPVLLARDEEWNSLRALWSTDTTLEMVDEADAYAPELVEDGGEEVLVLG